MTDDWAELLDGWVPIRLHWNGSEPIVEWGYLGARRFAEPFFQETITESRRLPFSTLFHHRTSMEALERRFEARPGLSPDGFVFHLSRCGSTLVAQMLAALPSAVVISEAGPIDSILRARIAHPSIAETAQIDWLRWIVSALGQRRAGDERYLFVKLDSWNTLALPLVRRAFPDVPWIFLYRDPVEVLVSQSGRPSAHLIPGAVEPSLFGLDIQTIESMRPEAFAAYVLSRVCEAALANVDDPSALLVEYRELPEAVLGPIARLFGIAGDDEALALMRSRAKLDAKNPLNPCAPRNEEDREPVESLRRAAGGELMALYQRLEAERTIPTATRL